MEFEKVKKKNIRPTHTGETESGMGKQKYFKVGLKVPQKLWKSVHK